LKVFQQWIETQPEDVQNLGKTWEVFLGKVQSTDGKGWVNNLRMVYRTPSRVSPPILEDSGSAVKVVAGSPAGSRNSASKKDNKLPKPIVPKGKGFGLEDVDAKEMARQLTLMDYELFQRIRPSEFNNLAWTRKTKEIDAPNLLCMIRRFNEVLPFFFFGFFAICASLVTFFTFFNIR